MRFAPACGKLPQKYQRDSPAWLELTPLSMISGFTIRRQPALWSGMVAQNIR